MCVIDGYDWLMSKPRTMSLKIESITEQTDGFGDPSEAYSPVGKQKFTFAQGGGFFDTQAAGLHAAMMAVQTGVPVTPAAVPRIGVVGVMGQTVGAVFYGLGGLFTTIYEVLYQNNKLTKANVMYAMAGVIEDGMIVQPLAAKTVSWNTKTLGTPTDYTLDPSQVTIPITSNSIANPTVITTAVPHKLATGHIVLISGVATSSPTINAELAVTVIDATHFSVPVNVTVAGTGGSFVRSNSLNGGAFYQEITAMTAAGFVGKIRDSADNTTFADLATAANATAAPNAQRITSMADQVVDRWLSFDGAVTGSGITAFGGFARF
jgi:hypothetical protein